MFESLLAKRYIFSQKRHTVLTICSIAIALALMTMLFAGFSTLTGCLRDVAYDNGRYHIMLMPVTKEQGEAMSEMLGDRGSCTLEECGNDQYEALLFFNEYIGDSGVLLEALYKAANIDPLLRISYSESMLMTLDMIDLNSRARMAQIFALFYIFVLFFVIMLRLVIDTAFEVSSKERERQFGVLQSIGATPKQIVRIITYEGLFLSVVGIPIGVASGIGLGFAAFKAVVNSGIAKAYFTPEKAAELLHFHVNPWLILLGTVTGLVWVLLSAYGTGMRIIRMSPIQAISMRSNTVKKVKKHSVFGRLFGWVGKLASRNNRRQPKRFLITVISLTLSVTLFASFSIIIDRVRSGALVEKMHDSVNFKADFLVSYFMRFNSSESFIDEFTKRAFDPMYYRSALDTIEDSSYFKNVDFNILEGGECYDYDTENTDIDSYVNVYVQYYCRDSYNKLFGGEPPISYDDLTEQGGYILLIDDIWRTGEYFADRDSISFEVTKRINLTANEYFALTPEEQELARPHEHHNGDTNTDSILWYSMDKQQTVELPISGIADGIRTEYFANGIVTIAGTLDEYENGECWLYGNSGEYIYTVISFDLADENKYQEALDFIDQQEHIALAKNNYDERRRIDAKFAAIRAVGIFLNVMIALVALVNMVNIISTGILNRRGEIAAMQCVGMTERQLYGMTVVECLQYVLTAAVMAVILCELLMFGTQILMGSMGLLDDISGLGGYAISDNLSVVISYFAPLPKIALASVLSFIAAFLASVIPLRRLQKTSLVEQVQSVD